jgi:F420-dependent oxidoreductase-like protein
MQLNVMLEPQEGMTYVEILAVAQRTEACGFAALYRSDHYKSVAARGEEPSTDAWATLAGLARETSRIALGTMVSPVTFRPAGNLAKVVATVAEMAGTLDGEPRVHLGLGTGWLETEHRQHGFPFEDLATRFRRLEEHLQVITGLWEQDSFSFDGEFEQLAEARFRPHPRPRPRIIVGGRGKSKTPTLVARYADEFNTAFASPQQCRELRGALHDACEREGRDPAGVTFSLMTGCLVGATGEEVQARARRLQQRSGNDAPVGEYLDKLRQAWVVGTPEEAAQRLGELAEDGVQRVMLQHQLYDDLDMLDLVATEIASRL